MAASPEIDDLIQVLARMPGLGPRSARRMVLYLLKKRETALKPMIRALESVDANMVACEICGNVDTRSPCGVCTDSRRDGRLLCVVEDVADLWALDKAGAFDGRFHVLGGTLSPLDGVGPDDLRIDSLCRRVEEGGVEEVVLALSATVDGQTTAHYVRDRLEPYGVSLTSLAHGVPVGGELDYLDEGTLHQAMRARRPVALSDA
ncbi:MAG: recombination mediator RecR [Pseudomonadota bacterium]